MQTVITALIVAASAAYLVWRYLPAAWRERLTGRTSAARASEGLGCAGCSGCSRASTPDQAMQVRFLPVRLASYNASSARSSANSSASPGR
jgi:hypothetical protein